MATINITRNSDEFEVLASRAVTHTDSIHDELSKGEKKVTNDVNDVDVRESSAGETTKTNASASATLSCNLRVATITVNKSCLVDDIIFGSTFQQDIPHIHHRLDTMTNTVSDCDTDNSKYTSNVDDIEASSHNTYETHSNEDDDSSKDEVFKVPNGENIISRNIHNGDGNCLPTVQEIHQSDHHYHHRQLKKPPLVACCALKNVIIGFVIFVMTLLFIYAMTIFKSNRTSAFPQLSGEATSTDRHFSANYNRTMEYLVQNNISTSISLLTYGSPQYYATSYIADQLQLPVPSIASSADDVTTSTHDATLLREQQTYRYIARYVLALDYYHFTDYNRTYHFSQDQSNNQIQEDKEIVEPPKFINFVTAGMDICQWNSRSQSTPTSSSNLDYYDTAAVQMGVTCSVSTKLPVNLTFSNMNLSGTIPTENGLLTTLQILTIENSNVIGTIPTELCQLTSLLYLSLGSNSLTGSIPAEIGHLSNLKSFVLNNNPGITGSVPTSITQLSSLRATYLDGTSLSSGVNQICSLPTYRTSDNNVPVRADVVAYADCGNGINDANGEVDCECCKCCDDSENSGDGCSMSFIN